MSKKVTTKEALEKCLSAYYFQEGSRANYQVIRKIKKLIDQLEKQNQ